MRSSDVCNESAKQQIVGMAESRRSNKTRSRASIDVYWKRAQGRPPAFETPEDLWKSCIQYFRWVESHPLVEEKANVFRGLITRYEVTKMRAMTLSAMCLYIGITRETWTQYRKKDGFSDICTRVDEIIKSQKFEGAAAEMLNPAIIARDLGLAEKRQITDDTLGGGGALTDAERIHRLNALAKTIQRRLEGSGGNE